VYLLGRAELASMPGRHWANNSGIRGIPGLSRRDSTARRQSTRVRRAVELVLGYMTPENQTRSPHHLVMSLDVTGGFLASAHLEFTDGLNCLIGGRGAGKTTALEFLRFGLGLMPDPKANSQRYRAIDGLVKANLGNGRLTIELRTKTDMKYTAGRSAHDAVEVLNEMGTAVPISLDRDQIFGADVFSQNEIEEIASSPAAQLQLLDRFEENETTSIDRELEMLQRQLDQSSIDLRQIDQAAEDALGRASELPVLEEKLKGLAEVAGPDASRINAAHAAKSLRTREEKVPGLLIAGLQKLVRDLASAHSTFKAGVDAQIDNPIREGANQEFFKALQENVARFIQHVAASVQSVEDKARELERNISKHSIALAERHAIQEAEYRTIVSASAEQSERAAERVAMQTALANAQSAANERSAKVQQRQAMLKDRSLLLNRVSELRDQRFALRKRVAEQLSGKFPSIRVTVAQAADVQEYQERVTDALKGSGVKQGPTAERLSQVFLPAELADVAAKNDIATLMHRAGFDEDRSKKILSALRTGGTYYTIETTALHDRPCIELLDGDTFKESTNLSTGNDARRFCRYC
jgi:hypothetical protein